MKVLLRKNVKKLGQIGEIVDVRPGYARNYLIPQGLAYAPTDGNIQAVEQEKEAYLAELARLRAELQTQANLLEGKEFTIEARANEEGHLYGSVGPAQIAAKVAESGVMIESDSIALDEPIRTLDKYEVAVDFGEEVTATIHVWVVPPRDERIARAEEAEEAEAETEAEAAGEPVGQARPSAEAEPAQAAEPAETGGPAEGAESAESAETER
jgi:large subunit ribosomal protein L9